MKQDLSESSEIRLLLLANKFCLKLSLLWYQLWERTVIECEGYLSYYAYIVRFKGRIQGYKRQERNLEKND